MVGTFFLVRDYFGEGQVFATLTTSLATLTAHNKNDVLIDKRSVVRDDTPSLTYNTILYKHDPLSTKPAPRKEVSHKAKSVVVAAASGITSPTLLAGPELVAKAAASKPIETDSLSAVSAPHHMKVPGVVETKAMVVLPSPTTKIPPALPEPTPSPTSSGIFRDCENCPEMYRLTGESNQLAVGLHEVTFSEWEVCIDDGGCVSRPSDSGWGGGDRPVINISYTMIVKEYLPWLSNKTGARYRLPTDVEWGEFAKNSDDSQARDFADAQTSSTVPVSELPPNDHGMTGLVGNVWEWVEGCRTNGFADSKSDSQCSHRIVRGGAWTSERTSLHAGARGWESASKTSNAIGFRVVREFSQIVGEAVLP
jgi:formylglycine-generating enzyme required for sulfatase activity